MPAIPVFAIFGLTDRRQCKELCSRGNKCSFQTKTPTLRYISRH